MKFRSWLSEFPKGGRGPMQARHRQTMFLEKNGGTQVDWAVFLEKRRYADRLGHISRQNEGTQIDRAIFLGKNDRLGHFSDHWGPVSAKVYIKPPVLGFFHLI